MKINRSEFLRKCQFPLMLASGTLPVALIIMALTAPAQLNVLWLFTGIYILLSIPAILLPGQYRIWFGIFGIALLLGTAFLLGGSSLWSIALIYCILLVFGLRIAGLAWSKELPIGWTFSGAILHTGAYILSIWLHSLGSNMLVPVTGWFAPSFAVYAVFAMLSLNRSILTHATAGRRRPSGYVRRRNAAMVLVFFVIVLAVSLLPAIAEVLGALWDLIKAFIAYLQSFVKPTGPVVDDAISATGDIGQNADTPAPVNARLWFILQKLAGPLLILFSLALIFKVGSALLPLLRSLGKQLRELLDAIIGDDEQGDTDYEDQIEDLRGSRVSRSPSAASGIRTGFWNAHKLPPRQQIRYRYRSLMKKHPEWKTSSTAREHLGEDLADFYERARYTHQDLTEAEAGVFLEGVKKL